MNGSNPLTIPGLTNLLLEGRKIDAIKLLMEHTGMGLAAAKQWVDAFPERKTTYTNRESVRARKTADGIRVTYTGNDGVTHEVTPGHPLWAKAKVLLKNNPLVTEAEAQSAVENTLPLNGSVFLEQAKGNPARWVKIAVVLLIAAAVLYVVLKW